MVIINMHVYNNTVLNDFIRNTKQKIETYVKDWFKVHAKLRQINC